MKWEEEFRPLKYEDVRGQDAAVRQLTGLARRRLGRSLLLTGAVGSGKTSITRVHARALNCETPNHYGSPCGACRNCRLPARDVMLEVNAASDEGRLGNVETILHEWNREPVHWPFRVIFFDEAHNLPANSQERLLKAVEDPAPGVVFVFATTEGHRLKAALRSRLQVVRIDKFVPQAAIDLLKDVAEQKGLTFDHAALSLIAAAKPYPRDMIIGLQQLSQYGRHIGASLVKDVFDLSLCDHLERYMLALASGDRAAQQSAMRSWHDNETTKARWVRLFLMTVYYNEVLGQRVITDALCYGMHLARREFVDGVVERLGLHNKGACVDFFERLLLHWHRNDSDDQTKIKLAFALFESLFSADAAKVQCSNEPSVERRPAPRQTRASVGLAAHQGECFPAMPDEGFVTAADVRLILNRASFLRQHHGILFNSSVRIEVPVSLVDTDSAEVSRLRAACRDLMAATAIADKQAGILSFEGDLGAPVARFLFLRAVSDEAASRAFADWRQQTEASGFSVHVEVAKEEEGAAFHWRAVRDLCAGFCEVVETENERPLRATLRIPRSEWRTPSPLRAIRLVFSGVLTSGAIACACEHEMHPLSAFDAQAWEFLYQDWEERENIDRLQEITVRRGMLADLATRHGIGSDAYAAAASKLTGHWRSLEAEERPRSYSGWWQ